MPSHIHVERSRDVSHVIFDRPEKHNALTADMRASIASTILDLDRDSETEAILVSGRGESFCAGMDMENLTIEESVDIYSLESSKSDFTLRNAEITTPIIAAITGSCIGAGMEFLQATDIRIAEEDAQFGLMEPRLGFVPGSGSITRLPRQVPYCRAMEFLLTGDQFDAQQALEAGLINRVVPKGNAIEEAQAVMKSITHNSTSAVETIKQTVERCTGQTMSKAFTTESELAIKALKDGDAEEGLNAFKEGRDPKF